MGEQRRVVPRIFALDRETNRKLEKTARRASQCGEISGSHGGKYEDGCLL
jgi:hypothetical protein